MKSFLLAVLLFAFVQANSQNSDTLNFFSKAFNTQRNVIVHLPEFYHYSSDSAKFPVIYVLDGQHNWFVEPVLSNIKYLQYTHEIPNVIVVVIPLENRNSECVIPTKGEQSKLLSMLVDELPAQLKNYKTHPFKLIIGHSFSASFALYAFAERPNYFQKVLSHSPYDQFENTIIKLNNEPKVDLKDVFLSFGSIAKDKDFFHRKSYEVTRQKFPEVFEKIKVFEVNFAGHTSLPIVANPFLLPQMFGGFSNRFLPVAPIDENYAMTEKPLPVSEELEKIKKYAKLDGFIYAPELAEINGIASRFINSNYYEHAQMVYELGLKYYPKFYDFHLGMYNTLSQQNKQEALPYLLKAEELLNTIEPNWDGKQELLEEIVAEIKTIEKN